MALIPTTIAIPDNEHGTVQHVDGHTLIAGDRTFGDLWYDGSLWCWRAADGTGFGRCDRRLDAIAYLTDGRLR